MPVFDFSSPSSVVDLLLRDRDKGQMPVLDFSPVFDCSPSSVDLLLRDRDKGQMPVFDFSPGL